MITFSHFIQKKGIIACALTMWMCFVPIHFMLWLVFNKLLHGLDIVWGDLPEDNFSEQLWFLDVFNVLILGPIVETIICQALVFYLLSLIHWFNKKKNAIIIVGAILFALIHFYSISYVIFTAITGGLFMYAYVVKIEKGALAACSIVAILHGLTNLFALFLEIFE